MKVSYQNDHSIYKYIENELNECGYGYNRKHTISINKYNRFDQSLSIMKGYLYNDPKYFIEMVDQNVASDVVKKYKIEDDTKNNIDINQYVKTYQQKVKYNTKIQIIEWIINLYEEIKNKNDDKINISNLLYFLGTIEWFHLAIIKFMFKTYNRNNIFIMGEHQDFDTLDENYNCREFFEFINSEYCSHSVVFMFTKQHLILFDPDYDPKNCGLLQYNKMCGVLGKKIMQIIPDQYISVQEITDDNYCIFHCFWFIQRIIQMNIDDNNINIFMDYVNQINKIIKKSDVYFFINDLNMKAIFYCANKKWLNKRESIR